MSNKKELIDKYLEANSSLDEEREIFNAKKANSELDPWFSFAKRSGAKAPKNMNDSVWDAIQIKRKKSKRLIYGLVASAASIALIITLSVNSSKQSDKEKEALLKEALSMFKKEEPKTEKQNIIYEDELIVIYTGQK